MDSNTPWSTLQLVDLHTANGGIAMLAETIAEQLFFSTVRIDTTIAKDSKGAGTGFYYSYKLPGNNEAQFVVTNKHVVMNTHEGSLSFLKQIDGQPTLGDGFQLKFSPQEWQQMWFGHPNPDIDIAICPLLPIINHAKQKFKIDLFIKIIGDETIPNEAQLAGIDSIESVTFVGYPNGVWDRKNFLPVARRGTTATPINVDFECTPRFLIDASVFGGSSGSPVFILDQGIHTNRRGTVIFGQRFYFIGVIAAVYFRTAFNEILSVPIPTQVMPMAKQTEMIDLGIVFKSRTVSETAQAFISTLHDNTHA